MGIYHPKSRKNGESKSYEFNLVTSDVRVVVLSWTWLEPLLLQMTHRSRNATGIKSLAVP